MEPFAVRREFYNAYVRSILLSRLRGEQSQLAYAHKQLEAEQQKIARKSR